MVSSTLHCGLDAQAAKIDDPAEAPVSLLNQLPSYLRAANGEDIPGIPQLVAEYFEKKIDPACLRIQLLMLPDAIKTAHEGTSVTIKKVTNPRTLADTLNQSTIYKSAACVLHLPSHECHCRKVLLFSSQNQDIPAEHYDAGEAEQPVPTLCSFKKDRCSQSCCHSQGICDCKQPSHELFWQILICSMYDSNII